MFKLLMYKNLFWEGLLPKMFTVYVAPILA